MFNLIYWPIWLVCLVSLTLIRTDALPLEGVYMLSVWTCIGLMWYRLSHTRVSCWWLLATFLPLGMFVMSLVTAFAKDGDRQNNFIRIEQNETI